MAIIVRSLRWLVDALLVAAVGSLLASCVTQAESDAVAWCEGPSFARRGLTPASEIDSVDSPALIYGAWRDGTSTVIGLCVRPGELRAPTLVDTVEGRRSMIGGTVAGVGGGLAQLAFFPATTSSAVEVWEGDALKALLRFPPLVIEECDLHMRTNAELELLDCGSLLVIARWVLPLQVEPQVIELIDIQVMNEAETNSYGFYKMDVGAEGDAVAVTFAFRRPRTPRVISLRFISALVRTEDGLVEELLSPQGARAILD